MGAKSWEIEKKQFVPFLWRIFSSVCGLPDLAEKRSQKWCLPFGHSLIFFFYRVLSVVMEGFVSPPTQLPCALEAFNWLCQAASGIWIYQLRLFLCKQGDLWNIAAVLQMQKARSYLWLWVVKALQAVQEWDGAVDSSTSPGTLAKATAGEHQAGLYSFWC